MSHEPIEIPIDSELDLHFFAPKDVASVVEEYVRAAKQSGFHIIRIVHGRGRGVQRGIVQATLERLPDVQEFWDDQRSSLGATFVRLTAPSPCTTPN